MQQQTSNFQDFKQLNQSRASSTSSPPSPSITPMSAASSSSNHAMSNLLNLQTNFPDATMANSYFSSQNPMLPANSNYNQATYSPAIMAAIANMSSISQAYPQNAITTGNCVPNGNYPYFEFANNFQQFIQQVDKKTKDETDILNESLTEIEPNKKVNSLPSLRISFNKNNYF